MRLGEDAYRALDGRLAAADADLARRYPGEDGSRQPVSTVYVPGDRYTAGTVREWGAQALAALPDVDIPALVGVDVTDRVRAKLEREPIEDLRIDFEDGYGRRPDDEEDAAALAAAAAPPGTFSFGIRFKSLEAPTRRRGIRTLDLYLEALGTPPPGLVLTLPKVTSVDQVTAMVELCERLEHAHGIPGLRFEVQVETPQAVLGPDGTVTAARMIAAGAGRISGLHYGTYDYSASLGIAAAYQAMDHPAADHAKAVMQLAAAQTGVRLSDGSTNVLPVGEGRQDAWRLHARLVRRSLARGFYQGWDLHPLQLITRYAATYAFYRDGLDPAAARLRAYLARSSSGVLDEPATAVALAGYLLRGVQCGALDADEVEDASGLSTFEIENLALRR